VAFSSKQNRFILQQLRVWADYPLGAELPKELAEFILGMHEGDSPFYDCRGNKDFQHNPLFWSGRILEPVINQWIKEAGPGGPVSTASPWPQGKKFAVCLTHDVDLVSSPAWEAQARFLKSRLKVFPKEKSSLKTWLADWVRFLVCQTRGMGGKGRAGFFEPWLELEDSFGFRSTFFFFPDLATRYHWRDGIWYRHQDILTFAGRQVTVTELMGKLAAREWEVGLHATYESFADPAELKKQKEQLERAVNLPVASVRQHGLHFDITKTPKAQSEAGFKFDSTYGFNRIVGFRNGLAWPFYHYDLEADAPLPILQIPLHIQDGALLRQDNLDLAPELALRRALELIDKVEKVHGLITLLWHPNVYDNNTYPGWFWVYEEVLKYLASRDAWVAPVRDIGNWWEARVRLASA